MQTDGDEDDQVDQEDGLTPEDEIATPDEVQLAIKQLNSNMSARNRLIGTAGLILRARPQLKRLYEAEDLFQDALERIGASIRKWPKNRVDFPGLVIGVMRSWSGSLEKKFAKTEVGVVYEHELTPAGDTGNVLDLEEVAGDSQTPEALIEAKAREALDKSVLVTLAASYEPQDLKAQILKLIINEEFDSHEKLRSALGVKEADYRNAWKALIRAAAKLNPKE